MNTICPTEFEPQWEPKALQGFETFGEKSLQEARTAAARFAEAIGTYSWRKPRTRPFWLTLTGPSGRGKTTLATILFRWFQANVAIRTFIKSGVICYPSCQFSLWQGVIDRLRNGQNSALDATIDADFAVIDDIGAEYATDFSTQKLVYVLERRKSKWTVLTSNLTAKDWADRETRISSRLIRNGSKFVNINARDYCAR